MIRRTTKWITWLIGLFSLANIVLIILTNVPTHVTQSDESVFRSILKLEKHEGPLSFEQEIELISAVQRLVLDEVPFGTPIPDYADREPKDLLKHKTGLCFDRSRTYDKIFDWMGFDVRHVYILYPEHPVTGNALPYWQAFFVRGIQSHAVTEVRTQRGWLVVDSNSTWLSVTKDGTPIDGDNLQERAIEFNNIPDYFNRPYVAIRGLYSRRGQLYRPFIPYPALNWVDFWSWMLGLD
jgi:hypothetical protein